MNPWWLVLIVPAFLLLVFGICYWSWACFWKDMLG